MGYFIIIRGPLGVGKSTIAQRLADALSASYISIDDVVQQHQLDKVDPREEGIPAKNFIIADDFILPRAKETLTRGKPVIFDACFYHKEHLHHVIENLPYPHYVFTLKAPIEVCIERDRRRDKAHGKDAAVAVHNLVSRFDYGSVIHTENQTPDQTVQEIMDYLP